MKHHFQKQHHRFLSIRSEISRPILHYGFVRKMAKHGLKEAFREPDLTKTSSAGDS
jgi:hypothetical protein